MKLNYNMFQSKEHLIRNSDPSLWGFAGLDINCEDESQKLSNRIWNVLNSKLFNGFIVLLVLIESLVIICLLLIDCDWIQDPSVIALNNCTNITNITSNTMRNTSYVIISSSKISPTLLIAKNCLNYSSLTIISFFFIEILLRIYSGKLKIFVHPFELLDALLVNVLFILSIVFFLHNSYDQNGSEKCSLLIVLLRLWRVFKIIQTLIEESQEKLIHLLNICDKEKTHAEHKNDILILKVEDLEHEVAYLKEKLKKTEKDNSSLVQKLVEKKAKKNAKRTQSSESTTNTTSYCPCRKNSFKNKPQIHNQQKHQKLEEKDYTLVNIETEPKIPKNIEPNVIDLDLFAINLTQSILKDVITLLSKNGENIKLSQNKCLFNGMRPVLSNKTIPSFDKHINSFIKPSLLKESLIYSNRYFITDETNHSQQSGIISNLNSAVHQLNEDLEIERIKKVEFNCNDLDIPLSSL